MTKAKSKGALRSSKERKILSQSLWNVIKQTLCIVFQNMSSFSQYLLFCNLFENFSKFVTTSCICKRDLDFYIRSLILLLLFMKFIFLKGIKNYGKEKENSICNIISKLMGPGVYNYTYNG